MRQMSFLKEGVISKGKMEKAAEGSEEKMATKLILVLYKMTFVQSSPFSHDCYTQATGT